MSTLYSIGQMNQLGDALEAEGFTTDDVTRLKQFGNLAGVRSVLRGLAKIKPVAEDATRVVTINETTIVVNLGTVPKFPFSEAKIESQIGEDWVIVEKRVDGFLYVNSSKVGLYLSRRQKGGKYLMGHELHEEVTGKPILNANLLDALMDNSHLIPENWKKDENGNTRFIFFWGTIYRGASGGLFVRFLYFRGGAWRSSYYRLDCGWDGSNPAALRAS